MINLIEGPLSQRRTSGKEHALEPPMNTDEHRLKADKEKRVKKGFVVVFILFLSVFIGVHRWLINLVLDLLNQDPSVSSLSGACDVSVSV